MNGANPLLDVPLNAPVVIAPGETKTFTVNLANGALDTAHILNQISLNGTAQVSTDPFQSWADANGLTEGVDDGFNENPDFDPFPNGLEWILGGNTPLITFDRFGIGTTGELLVVITIVIVLAALVFRLGLKARDSALRSQCVSSLRQLAFAGRSSA